MAYSNLNFDRSERVDYDKFDYPVYIRKGRMSAYPNFSAESHWHDDLEFIAVLSGVMQYNVNGENVTLCEGGGDFRQYAATAFRIFRNEKRVRFSLRVVAPDVALFFSRDRAEIRNPRFVQRTYSLLSFEKNLRVGRANPVFDRRSVRGTRG